jgi:hypothetical protein
LADDHQRRGVRRQLDPATAGHCPLDESRTCHRVDDFNAERRRDLQVQTISDAEGHDHDSIAAACCCDIDRLSTALPHLNLYRRVWQSRVEA